MKKKALVLAVMLGVTCWYAGLEAAGNEPSTQRHRDMLGILKTYSPSGYYIVSSAYSLPERFVINGKAQHMTSSDPLKFTENKSKDDADYMKNLCVVVHESCHAYQRRMGSAMAQKNSVPGITTYFAFYIPDKNENILVPISKRFPSKELAPLFTEEMKAWRFGMYINSSIPEMGTQYYGIYGLLDEFGAYYHNVKAAADFYPWYKKHALHDINLANKFFEGFYRDFYSYIEFKLYIALYLKYAKENKPEIYRDIAGNEQFLAALKELNRSFKKDIKGFFTSKKAIFADIRQMGITVYEDELYIYLKKDEKQAGTTHFINDFTRLRKHLDRPEYREILKTFFGEDRQDLDWVSPLNG